MDDAVRSSLRRTKGKVKFPNLEKVFNFVWLGIRLTRRTSRQSSPLDETVVAIERLRNAELHPAELGLTTPLASKQGNAKFMIEVPVEESDEAKKALEKSPPHAGP